MCGLACKLLSRPWDFLTVTLGRSLDYVVPYFPHRKMGHELDLIQRSELLLLLWGLNEKIQEKHLEQYLYILALDTCQQFFVVIIILIMNNTLVENFIFCSRIHKSIEQKYFLVVFHSIVLHFLIKTFYLIVNKKPLPKQRWKLVLMMWKS